MGVCGGDFNSIVDKKDSLIHPDQKMSKCLAKLIKLFGLRDAFRVLYPHSRQYSRYYTAKGVAGATRIDRCYLWGNLGIEEAVMFLFRFQTIYNTLSPSKFRKELLRLVLGVR